MSQGGIGSQIVVLGAIFVGLGLITDGAYALTAGAAAEWLRRHERCVASERWVSGGMYIGLGVAAALSSGQRSSR